jgi:DNA-binding transcriptional regulator WhiA
LYKTKPIIWNREVLAYLVGIGLGDGNLSKPNGRSVRLRVSCDLKYPFLTTEIIGALYYVLPESKVGIVERTGRCLDISSHSNYWEMILGWKANEGSKYIQNATVPEWIWCKDEYIKACLKGLIETDGSIYYDRGYPMVMFTNIVADLAKDVFQMMNWLGFQPRIYDLIPKSKFNVKRIYHVRLAKNVQEFLNLVQPLKA